MQGQIVNLLQELNRRLGLTIVLISHDLAIVARICAQIAVMQAGKIVEIGPARQVLVAPSHPYTRTLLDSIPRGLQGRARPRAGDERIENLGWSEPRVPAPHCDDTVKLRV
jgi:ABC-type dipeptide/oligopeptide/nickel transport system ATPase component